MYVSILSFFFFTPWATSTDYRYSSPMKVPGKGYPVWPGDGFKARRFMSLLLIAHPLCSHCLWLICSWAHLAQQPRTSAKMPYSEHWQPSGFWGPQQCYFFKQCNIFTVSCFKFSPGKEWNFLKKVFNFQSSTVALTTEQKRAILLH